MAAAEAIAQAIAAIGNLVSTGISRQFAQQQNVLDPLKSSQEYSQNIDLAAAQIVNTKLQQQRTIMIMIAVVVIVFIIVLWLMKKK